MAGIPKTGPEATDQIMMLAVKQHQAGNLNEAEKIYRQVLSREPANAGALHLLGVIALQANRVDEAIELMRKALLIAPAIADFHLNLGNALRSKGRLEDSVAAYRQVLKLDPCHAMAFNNLGIVQQDLGLLDDAIDSYRQATTLKPAYAAAHNNLGNALTKKGRLDEAIGRCREAIRLQPNLATAYMHLAVALEGQKRFEEAVASYEQAIGLQAEFAEAYSNLAGVLQKLNRVDEAVVAYRKAIQLKPNLAEAYVNLALVLADQGDFDGGIAMCREATRLKPESPESYLNLLYFVYHHPDFGARELLGETREWAQRQRVGPSVNWPVRHQTPQERLKIGYLSTFFRTCADAHFIYPLIAEHAHENFETFCYALRGSEDDEISNRFRTHCDHWMEMSQLSVEAATEVIRGHGIDILVNITRPADRWQTLLTKRLAPIQITWLTFASCTTGLEAVDYRISDPYVDPLAFDESCYCEKTLRLPETAWCYDPLLELPPVSPPPALANGFITFGSFNRFHKINKPVLATWSEILRAVPNSRLLMFAESRVQRERLLDLFGEGQIDPARIEFVGPLPRIEYLKQYGRTDIILDTFPFAGLTTAMDSLCMGVPLVTLSGKTGVGRIAASALHNLQMADLIASDREEYVAIAARLSQDVKRLAELRASLRAKTERSPLMDAPRFARHVEALYQQIWEEWWQSR